MGKKEIRILFIQTIEIKLLDIPRALDELEYSVYKASLNISAQGYKKESCEMVKTAICNYNIQYVISYDFSESIAQACYETGIPYIAWVYDTPQRELYTHYALYPCNYIFVFDKKQKERLREIGIKNVYYMPLAIMPNKVEYVLKDISKEKKSTEITFIGQLYKVNNVDSIMNQAEEKIRQSVEANVEDCFLRWDENMHFHGNMDDCCVRYFSLIDEGKVLKKYPYMSEQFYYETAITSRMLANRERIAILNTLAEKYDVRLYTNYVGTEELSDKVKIMSAVKYDEISEVYYNSKININITLHCIESGAPQRIFDVMAAGGFMLSNYQKELEELFVPGEEIVLYHTLEELEELVEYYLTHEEERNRIAKKGQKKVLRCHDLHNSMEYVLDFVMKKEKNREKSYSDLHKEWTQERINSLLAKKEKESYQRLYRLLQSMKYTEDVPKQKELGRLEEIMDCWKIESESSESGILSNISSIKEAEQKYTSIKHKLWRIESNLSEEVCRETVYQMCEIRESLLLIAWIIRTHMKNREELFLKVSEYMLEYDVAGAIKLLSYGSMYFPKSEMLLSKKAEYMNLLKDILEEIYYE